MKKFFAIIVSSIMVMICFSGFNVFANEIESDLVTIDTTYADKTITAILRTGEDLYLPKLSAMKGNTDVTEQVNVNVYDAQNKKINAEGAFVAENLKAGSYSVEYYVGETKSTPFTVVVSDAAPSALLSDNHRPVAVAYRDVAYRVRAIEVGDAATVVITLYDNAGNEVCTEEQKETSRQITLNPSQIGWNNVTYKIIEGEQTVLCSFPVFVDIKDYEGDYFGYSFEGDDWIDAYGIGTWCSTPQESDALSASISKEQSRSGASCLKFTAINLDYQPSMYFRLDFGNDYQMRKDDISEYTLRFYMKKGEDFAYDGRLPVVDFHALAKKTSTDAHYGAYKWNLGNFLIKQSNDEEWTLIEYTFISYSDEYIFSKDWLESSPNYSSYGGMQFVIVPTNYTGTIYIDDVQLFKNGVEVDDLLDAYPHENAGNNNPNSDSSENETNKSGCSSTIGFNTLGIIGFLAIGTTAIILFYRKLQNKQN